MTRTPLETSLRVLRMPLPGPPEDCRRCRIQIARNQPSRPPFRPNVRAATLGRKAEFVCLQRQPGLEHPNPGSVPPLSEIHHGFVDIARPVGWQDTAPDIDVK